uniref:Uncharacterized protein n=1 Tax=Arundo donax TaxID=35708 RepID=A0A0A8ZV03_ARUDO
MNHFYIFRHYQFIFTAPKF